MQPSKIKHSEENISPLPNVINQMQHIVISKHMRMSEISHRGFEFIQPHITPKAWDIFPPLPICNRKWFFRYVKIERFYGLHEALLTWEHDLLEKIGMSMKHALHRSSQTGEQKSYINSRTLSRTLQAMNGDNDILLVSSRTSLHRPYVSWEKTWAINVESL